MFSLSKPIDAVKKLNEDFGLHIEIGKVPTAEEVSEYQKWIAEKRAYEVWGKVGLENASRLPLADA